MLGLDFLPLEFTVLAVVLILVVPSKENVGHKVHPQTRATGSKGDVDHHN